VKQAEGGVEELSMYKKDNIYGEDAAWCVPFVIAISGSNVSRALIAYSCIMTERNAGVPSTNPNW
jgi:hypothetical protein